MDVAATAKGPIRPLGSIAISRDVSNLGRDFRNGQEDREHRPFAHFTLDVHLADRSVVLHRQGVAAVLAGLHPQDGEGTGVDPGVVASYERAFQQGLEGVIQRTRDPELRQAFEAMRQFRFAAYIVGSLVTNGVHETYDPEDCLQRIVFRMLSPVGERGLPNSHRRKRPSQNIRPTSRTTAPLWMCWNATVDGRTWPFSGNSVVAGWNEPHEILRHRIPIAWSTCWQEWSPMACW